MTAGADGVVGAVVIGAESSPPPQATREIATAVATKLRMKYVICALVQRLDVSTWKHRQMVGHIFLRANALTLGGAGGRR